MTRPISSVRKGYARAIIALGLSLGAAACSAPTGSNEGALTNVALSRADLALSASVPEIAVDRSDPSRVAVIWRYISMKDANRRDVQRHLECRLSLSSDGGRTFSEQLIEWGTPETPVCNSPFVDIGPEGQLLIGATLAGAMPQGPRPGVHPHGQVGMRLSTDWGKTWTTTQGLISSGDRDKFAPNAAVPHEATEVPWDGGRGVIDYRTGAITILGGFPAPPGEDLNSQRFFTVSRDDGRSWGPIYAFGGPGWPQRWDGTLVAAHGKLALTYLADAVPTAGAKCLCLVFATSSDAGQTLERHFVTEIDHFDKLVHYPPVAAHPTSTDTYAIAFVRKNEGSPSVRITYDDGKSWRAATGLITPEGVDRSSRPAIAYAPGGELVLLWRGYYADSSYAIFMAASRDGRDFTAPVAVSTERSREPEEYFRDYSVTGDFISALAAGPDAAYGAWTDWRSGKAGQIMFVRVPLAKLAER